MNLETGDVLYYLGKKRILTVVREERSRAKVRTVLDRIIIWVPYEADYEYKRECLEKWYRKEALAVIEEKAEIFAEALSVQYNSIRIKDQKSRWGSCSNKGNLNFNWRIIMAPELVFDYIIIHELCHLEFMDHSVNFWNLLESICPEYRRCMRWLKENSSRLYPF